MRLSKILFTYNQEMRCCFCIQIELIEIRTLTKTNQVEQDYTEEHQIQEDAEQPTNEEIRRN